jgi:hypothetical protein
MHLLSFVLFSNELQSHSDAQQTIEKLKRTLDETTFERDQTVKNMTMANKKVILRFIF